MWESPGTSRSQALGDMQASDHIQTCSRSYSHHTQSQATTAVSFVFNVSLLYTSTMFIFPKSGIWLDF